MAALRWLLQRLPPISSIPTCYFGPHPVLKYCFCHSFFSSLSCAYWKKRDKISRVCWLFLSSPPFPLSALIPRYFRDSFTLWPCSSIKNSTAKSFSLLPFHWFCRLRMKSFVSSITTTYCRTRRIWKSQTGTAAFPMDSNMLETSSGNTSFCWLSDWSGLCSPENIWNGLWLLSSFCIPLTSHMLVGTPFAISASSFRFCLSCLSYRFWVFTGFFRRIPSVSLF